MTDREIKIFELSVGFIGILLIALATYLGPSAGSWTLAHLQQQLSSPTSKPVEMGSNKSDISPQQSPLQRDSASTNPVAISFSDPKLARRSVVVIPVCSIFDDSNQETNTKCAVQSIYSAIISVGFSIPQNPPEVEYPKGLVTFGEMHVVSATTQLPEDAAAYAASVNARWIVKLVYSIHCEFVGGGNTGREEQANATLKANLYLMDVRSRRYIGQVTVNVKSDFDYVPKDGGVVSRQTISRLFEKACGAAVKQMKTQVVLAER